MLLLCSAHIPFIASQYTAGRYKAHIQTSPAAAATARPLRKKASLVQPEPNERTFLLAGVKAATVARWLDSWWQRWSLLALLPSLCIWLWIAIPFPVSEINDPAQHNPDNEGAATIYDASFAFFVFWFYGAYLAIALLFITSLFGLYRLNWWPSRLGGAVSYFFFWSASIAVGIVFHKLDVLGARQRWDRKHHSGGADGAVAKDWERKTVWVLLSVGTMSMPALVCFAKLRRDRRMTYRHSLTGASDATRYWPVLIVYAKEMQKTFLERQLTSRIPRSYIRFLWFCASIAVALFTLSAGQGFASVYLSTLPHNSIDGVCYVWSWVITTNLLSVVTCWVLAVKVRSKGLVFVFRYYYYLVSLRNRFRLSIKLSLTLQAYMVF